MKGIYPVKKSESRLYIPAEPKMIHTPNGNAFVLVSGSVGGGNRDDKEKYPDRLEYFHLWKELAEKFNEKINKGDCVIFRGFDRTKSYMKDGKKVYQDFVYVNEVSVVVNEDGIEVPLSEFERNGNKA